MFIKFIKPVFFAFVCAVFLLGCKTEPQKKSPTETIKALSEASKQKDPAAIKSYLSKGTLDMLDQSAKRREKSVDELLREENGAPMQNLTEVKNEQITGDTATVEVKNNVTGAFEKIPFVSENDVWKVALDKYMQDAIKRLNDEMNQPPANISVPENTNKSPNENKR
jgi:hypothetical protein